MESKSKEAKQKLEEFIPIINQELEKLLNELKNEEINAYSPFAGQLVEHIKLITMAPAKRLRASFVYYSYLMHGGKNIKDALLLGAVVELVHAAWLIIDDFCDISDTRRGVPTFHQALNHDHKINNMHGDGIHYGNSMAATAGVYESYYANTLLDRLDIDLSIREQIRRQLTGQIMQTAIGQMYDITNTYTDPEKLTEQDIINVLYWKTGIYTYDNPIQLGAILAGANSDQKRELKTYGHQGGVSFQIQDDILGVFGNEGKTGKSAESDIKEGKQTLLTWHAYKYANNEQKQIMKSVIGNRNSSSEDIDLVRKIMKEVGSHQYSIDKSMELVKNAQQSIINKPELNWGAEGLEYLIGIADYMIEREL
jgi:geranylgeranyl diphosphate synthase, type II